MTDIYCYLISKYCTLYVPLSIYAYVEAGNRRTVIYVCNITVGELTHLHQSQRTNHIKSVAILLLLHSVEVESVYTYVTYLFCHLQLRKVSHHTNFACREILQYIHWHTMQDIAKQEYHIAGGYFARVEYTAVGEVPQYI